MSRWDTTQSLEWCRKLPWLLGFNYVRIPWWNKPGGDVDARTGWFHDILHADGTPYREQEIAAIRKIAAEARGKGV